jgi:hypothetical protein
MRFFFTLSLLLTLATGAHAAPVPRPSVKPTEKFLKLIKERNEKFKALHDGVSYGTICPAGDSPCVLKELKRLGIKSSNDLFNGMTLLSFLIQKKFKQSSECHEVCRTNLYAEFSDALYSFAQDFDVANLLSYTELNAKYNETKVVKAIEDLECFKQLKAIQNKLTAISHKIDPEKIFRPELAKRMKELRASQITISPEAFLKDSYLASLSDEDPVLDDVILSGGKDKKAAKAHIDALVDFQKTMNPETH